MTTPVAIRTTLNTPQLVRVLIAALYTPGLPGEHGIQWGLPVVLWGPPGAAKSSVCRQVARLADLPDPEILCPGERGEGEFGVVPVPSADGYIDHPMPRWAQRFMGSAGGLVVGDELTTATPSIQTALLSLVLDRRIGGRYLGGRTRVIAAGNPPDQAASGNELAPPLANRLIHLYIEPPQLTDWVSYMANLGAMDTDTTGSVAPRAPEGARVIEKSLVEEARVLALWPAAYARSFGGAAQFLKTRSGLLHDMPEVGSPQAGAAWPSHRSWEMAIRAQAGASIHGLTADETMALVSGSIGKGAATEFVNYITKLDLPDPEEVLDGVVRLNWQTMAQDRMYAILTSLVSYAASLPTTAPKRDERAIKVWKILLEVCDIAIDLAYIPARAASVGRLTASGTNREVMTTMGAVMRRINESAVKPKAK